jgi:hypothetical protein
LELATPSFTRSRRILTDADSAALEAASGPVTAAYSFEWDVAVSGGGPSGDYACVSTAASKACFQPYGDKIWVKDLTGVDQASAVARWYTDYGRWGTCRNALGAGHWGVCNKNFAENHWIYWRASQYDGDTGQYVGGESGLATSGT